MKSLKTFEVKIYVGLKDLKTGKQVPMERAEVAV